MIPSEWVDQADARIAPHIVRTPLTYDAARNLYIKWENHQKTGSFKARGALSKALLLTDLERQVGIVTVSSGNHGKGVAFAGRLTETPVTCFLSEQAIPAKVDAIRSLGAEIVTVEGGYAEAEMEGKIFAQENDRIWISPYNDPYVISGQGTIGLEIMQNLNHHVDTTYLVPVGGGGLLAGIAVALSRLSPRPRLVGVQPDTTPFMYELFYHDSQEGVPDLPSLADGLVGAVEEDSITTDLVKQLVDDIVLVSEDEMARAVAFAYYEYGETIEPSAAVTIAAALTGLTGDGPQVAVVSGGNVQPEVHARIVADYAGKVWA